MDKQVIQPKEPTITLFPYPVYLISCAYKGRQNITPVGWAAPICNEPPMFGISLRSSRFSHQLILKSKKFAINFPTIEMLKDVDYCGTFSGKGRNKLKNTGFNLIYPTKKSPPIIKECPVNIECKVISHKNYGQHTHFIGKMEKIYVDKNYEALIEDSFVVIGTKYYGLTKSIGNCRETYK